MNKKIIGMFVLGLVIATVFGTTATVYETVDNLFNVEENVWSDNGDNDSGCNDEIEQIIPPIPPIPPLDQTIFC